MTKFSRKVEYALMALKYMFEKEQGSLISAKDVSEVLGTPVEVTAKILQTLTADKVLQSEKGLQGGYKLQQDLRELSLYRLVEIIEGQNALVKCIHSDSACDIQKSCNIVSPLTVLNSKVQKFFENISVAELLTPDPESRKSSAKDELVTDMILAEADIVVGSEVTP